MTLQRRFQILLGLTAILIVLVYANSLSVPFYFDDLNLINDTLRIDSLTIKNLIDASLHGYAPNRPVANLTLVLNHYFSHGESPLQFHIVNIIIHVLGFFFLFWFLRELLALPAVPSRYRSRATALALVSSAVWALHPLQTQAVTYIIQRMTSLCALFYFMSLYFYLKARTRKKWGYYVLSTAAFFLALGSKEIAVTIPVAVLLIEWIFFKPDKKKLLAGVLIVFLGFVLVSFLFVGADLSGVISSLKQNQYGNRDYLISERLLTQPRVFVHYISLALFPFYDRYILDYGYKASHSLFSPVSTFFSALFLLATIAAAFLLLRKNRIVAFSIFAFWLGHVIEGSIFNIEIVFEHRMYLPSAFLFLAAVVLIGDLLGHIKIQQKWVFVLIGGILFYLGLNTVLRNRLWQDPVAFYLHNIKKKPDNFRPYHNLGVAYGVKDDFNMALSYFFKAATMNPSVLITDVGIGQTYFSMKKYDQCIPYYLKALEGGLLYPFIYDNVAISHLRLNEYEEAIKAVLKGMEKFPKHPGLKVTAGSIYYCTVQQIGNDGLEVMKKYGMDENKAFELLDSAYSMGNRNRDVFVNLPPAIVRKAFKETAPGIKAEMMKKAEGITIEGMKNFPADGDIRNNLAGILLYQGRWQEAAVIPGMSVADMNKLVLSLMNGRQFTEALDVLDKMEYKFGLDQIIQYNKANCYYFLGRQDEAVKIFKDIYANTANEAAKAQVNQFIKDWERKRVQK
jgi:protein O-mannosyl-transferase